MPIAEVYAGYAQIKSHAFARRRQAAREGDDRRGNPAVRAQGAAVPRHREELRGRPDDALGGCSRRPKARSRPTTSAASISSALAYATAAGDRPLAALPIFDRLWKLATPTEKAVMVARDRGAVRGGAAGRARAALRSHRAQRPELGASRESARGATRISRGDASARREAARRGRRRSARRSGCSKTITAARSVARRRRGAPGSSARSCRSATQSRIADAAVAGLGLAAGAPNGAGVAAIEVRAAKDKTEGEQAVDQLARQERDRDRRADRRRGRRRGGKPRRGPRRPADLARDRRRSARSRAGSCFTSATPPRRARRRSRSARSRRACTTSRCSRPTTATARRSSAAFADEVRRAAARS